MLIFMLAIGAFATLIRVFATEPSHLIFSAFFGGNMGFGDFYAILLAMIADVATPKERQEAISTMFLFSSIGMFISPILCTSVLLLPQITLRNIYQISFIAQIITILYITFKTRETKPKVLENAKPKIFEQIKDLVRQKDFQGLSVSVFPFYLSRSIIQIYLQIYGKVNLNLSDAEVASFRIYTMLAVMLIRLLSATLLTRAQPRPALISFLVFGGITCLVSPLANNYLYIILIQFLSGISFGAVKILSSVLVADISTPNNRGTANSILSFSESSGHIMQLATSPIVEIYGYTPTFIIGGIGCLIGTLPQFTKLWKHRRSLERN